MDDDPVSRLIKANAAVVNYQVATVLAQFYTEHGRPMQAEDTVGLVSEGVRHWTQFLMHTGTGVDKTTIGLMIVGGERMGLSAEDVMHSIELTLQTIADFACTHFGPGDQSNAVQRRLHSALAIARMRFASAILERITGPHQPLVRCIMGRPPVSQIALAVGRASRGGLSMADEKDYLLQVMSENRVAIESAILGEMSEYYAEHGVDRADDELEQRIGQGMDFWMRWFASPDPAFAQQVVRGMVTSNGAAGVSPQLTLGSIELTLDIMADFAKARLQPAANEEAAARLDDARHLVREVIAA